MPRKLSLFVLPLLLLAGCSETREMLGLNRNMPDEFAVVDRAPLVLPPDYTLRPPRPGAARPQDVAPRSRAEAAAFGTSAPGARAPTDTLEQQVLANAGADKATPGIRKLIDNEGGETVGDRHLVDELLWWRKKDDNAVVVDANAEAQRLRAAKAGGKAATSGATPIIEKRESGWLGL